MSEAERPEGRGAWRIFRWPLAIGVASTVGLVAALVGNGAYDVLSWVMLGGAVAVMVEAWRRGDTAAANRARPARPGDDGAGPSPT